MMNTCQKLCILGVALLVSTSSLARHDTPQWTAEELLQLDKQSQALNQKQWARVEAQVQGNPAPKLWLITVGMSAESMAFGGDVARVREFFSQVKGEVVSLTYNNWTDEKSAITPLAHTKQLAKDLARVGELLSKDDKVLLMISTHGTKKELSVNVADFFGGMSDNQLSKTLEPLKDTPTALIISACHSGSFIPVLKANHRMILTSAAADRSSFGCSFKSDGTWFIKALMANNDAKKSLKSLFDNAQETIFKWETKESYKPSQPQIFIGSSTEQWADLPITDWLK